MAPHRDRRERFIKEPAAIPRAECDVRPEDADAGIHHAKEEREPRAGQWPAAARAVAPSLFAIRAKQQAQREKADACHFRNVIRSSLLARAQYKFYLIFFFISIFLNRRYQVLRVCIVFIGNNSCYFIYENFFIFSISGVTEVTALAKGVAELPCDVTSPDASDPVRLVLWYRAESSTPIYR